MTIGERTIALDDTDLRTIGERTIALDDTDLRTIGEGTIALNDTDPRTIAGETIAQSDPEIRTIGGETQVRCGLRFLLNAIVVAPQKLVSATIGQVGGVTRWMMNGSTRVALLFLLSALFQ
jgi:hypothetical protein